MRQLKITRQITLRNEGSINRYFQEINRYPLISAEEEAELAGRIKNGDNGAKERLVLSNLRFVVSVAKQYQNQGVSFNDLINEGNIGLVKAAEKYDETRGFRFISYAVWWIRQSIIQSISGHTRIVRLPLNRISSINKINKATSHLEQEFEREPTEDEVAGYLEVTREEVKLANNIKRQQLSFDMPLSQESDNSFSLYDVIQTGDIPSPDNLLLKESVSTDIDRILKKLTNRDASVLIMSFGLYGTQACSLQEIGLKLQISSERVRQIKTSVLLRLRRLLKESHPYLYY